MNVIMILNLELRIDEFSKLIKRADKKDSIEISISEQNMLLVTVGKIKNTKCD